MTQGIPELSIVMPLFNEDGGIGETVAALHDRLRVLGAPYELVLVDDGSTDETWDAVIAIAEQDATVRAVRFSRNFGKESAILCGLAESRGRAVAIMDADLEHPPEALVRMVELWRAEGWDIVEGVKSVRGGEPFYRRWSAALFYRLMRFFSGYDLRGASDFKLLSRRAVDTYLSIPERGRFYRGLVAWMGLRHASVAFEVPLDRARDSHWTPLRLVQLSARAITAFSYVPLHLVTVVGFLTFVFSVVLGAQTLWRWASGHAVEGFTTVILTVLFSASVTMLSLGVIGEYLARIYDEVKRRPPYVVMDRAGRDE